MALLPARRPAGAALRLPRARAVRPGGRAPVQPREAPDRPVRQGDRGRRRLGRRQHAPVRPGRRRHPRRRRPRDRRRGLRRRDAQVRRRRRVVRLGGRRPPRAAVERDGHLRDPRQGLHDDPPRRPRGPARHLRGPGLRRRARLPEGPRRHGGRAPPGPPHRRRVVPPRHGPQQLLGLRVDRLPRAARRLLGVGHPRPAGLGVQGHGQGPPQGRHRGHPRRRLQPHRGGQPPRPDALDEGRRQQDVLPPGPRRPAPLHGLHGHGQHARRPAARRAADDHGLAAVLRDRVPRRRLPLRPRVRPGPRALRRRPPLRVLRHDPPGPGALAGEAHRRALGRRSRRVPGGQLPGALERVERHLPRPDPRLLARGRRCCGLRGPLLRLRGPLRGRRPRPVRVDQLRDRPRRLHDARPRHLQREAQRGQPGGRTGRHRRQPLLELRRRGRDRRPGRQQAPASAAAQHADDAAPVAGHADAARRRRDRPHAERQQQRVVPGQRDLLVLVVARGQAGRAARVHPSADPPARGAPGVPPPGVPARSRSRGRQPARRLVVPPRRPPHDHARVGRPGLPRPRRVPQRRRDRGPHAARRAAAGRLVRPARQRAPRGRDVHAPVHRLRRGVELELCTFEPTARADGDTHEARSEFVVRSRSITILKRAS